MPAAGLSMSGTIAVAASELIHPGAPAQQQDQAQEQHQEPTDAQNAPERRGRGWIGWLVSGSLHLLALLVMWCIYWVISPPALEVPPVRNATIDQPSKQPQRPVDRTLESHVDIAVDLATQPDPISQVDVTVPVAESELDTDSSVPKGRAEAVSDSEMGGQGAFSAIGSGGGGAGMYGARTGGGRHRAISRYGGSKGSESAVDAALRWLKRHQDPTGCWDAETYQNNCTLAGKCEPGTYKVWKGNREVTCIALTGYAALCFLGAGYDQAAPSRYRATVRQALAWLTQQQHADGRFGETNYENAIAVMALAEACAMSPDPAIRAIAQRGVDSILAAQCQEPGEPAPDASGAYCHGLGWDYNVPTARNDSSVTGWNVMALKSAFAAGLNVHDGLTGARRWLDLAYRQANPNWQSLDAYTGRAVMPYAYFSDTKKLDFINPANLSQTIDHEAGVNLSCVGLVCAVFLGHHAGDPMLQSLANEVLARQLPAAYPFNTYYMYYNTMGMFQVGGEAWKTWNARVRDMLVHAQRQGPDCHDGSWDPDGTVFIGHEIGRVLSTCYCCLCLEVYYRYAQVAGVGARH